jgi:hypothetical protein
VAGAEAMVGKAREPVERDKDPTCAPATATGTNPLIRSKNPLIHRLGLTAKA